MMKIRKKPVFGIVLLLMLGASPISVTYSFADTSKTGQDETHENQLHIEKNAQNEKIKGILTEKIVNGKLEVRHYALPDRILIEDMKRILLSDEQTSSWTYVTHNAYESGIVLFDGKVSKEESKFWTIVSNNPAKFQENPPISELKANSNEITELSDKTFSEENFSYKVIFSGNNANMIEENEYVISLMKLGVDSHYEENEILQFTDKNESYPISIEPTNFNQNYVDMIVE